MRIIYFTLMVLVLFTGCAQKEPEEFNKPAVYWYNKMIKEISRNQLDAADDTFTSLESEHRNSPLIPSAIMIIATAHMDDEEYTMANYYFDEYLKRFSIKKNADYIRYLKIKTNFLAFKYQFRDQSLLTKTLIETDKFLEKYQNSKYVYLVKTIKARLLMAKATFDKEIAELYTRLEKPKAEEFYKDKASSNWKNLETIKDIDVPWYRWIFE